MSKNSITVLNPDEVNSVCGSGCIEGLTTFATLHPLLATLIIACTTGTLIYLIYKECEVNINFPNITINCKPTVQNKTNMAVIASELKLAGDK